MTEHIAVTGAAGYIGSALLPLLQDDDDVSQVTVLDDLSSGSRTNLEAVALSDNFNFREVDVRDYGEVENGLAGADGVIHLAAITGAPSTHDRPDETRAVNYEGTENVLAAAAKNDLDNVVFASTCNLYGRAASDNLDETIEPDPLSPYAETKYESEQLVRERAEEHGFNGISLRMSTNYGYAPGIRFNLVINYFVFRALTGEPLTVYGDGSNWRPYIHVRDAARAYKHAVLNPEKWDDDVYNVGLNDQNYRVEEIAEIVREEVGDVEITYLGDKNPGPSYNVNFDKVKQTGFQPEWSVREGVNDLVNRFVADDRTQYSLDG
ncbi:NAD-dependent epimerase/dehydratase family protein [Halorientalis litorea]|uniref:NAD-dependent epimerase/dehydratase family protein n=1 Tax=Halorientalis litorea TaxID=2931977 RepID=UPI001FF4772F|nr:SDR family oxidoreductase [Halorientalis litorea]